MLQRLDGSASIHQEHPAAIGYSIAQAEAPDQLHIMDVVDHKELWVTPVDGENPRPVFRFADPQVRTDYPAWTPSFRTLSISASMIE